MNFGPVLILIQINENEKRKCPSLGRGGLKEGGGGLPMSGCKKGWESGGSRTNAYFISISICCRYTDT